MAKKILIAICLTLLVGVTIVAAAGLSVLSDEVSRHAPSTASNHTLRFKTALGLGNSGESLTIEFESGFDLTAITDNDISLSTGSVSGEEFLLNVSSIATLSDWGVQIAGQQIILMHPTDNSEGDVVPGDFVVIKIGTQTGGANQIVNPPTLGSSIVRISTSLGESGALAIPIADDQVGVNGELGNPSVTIQWAVPQQRVGTVETNDDAIFFLTARTPVNSDDVILHTQPTLATLDPDGTYLVPIELSGIGGGTYDIGIKTQQHLTRVLQDINLSPAVVTNLNFSDPANGLLKGSQVLLAGDINGTGVDNTTLGDDVINSVDLSALISVIDADDVSGNSIRANLNQDIVVNSVDLSMLISNLDAEGDN